MLELLKNVHVNNCASKQLLGRLVCELTPHVEVPFITVFSIQDSEENGGAAHSD